MSQPVEITALTPDHLARLLSSVCRRRITEEQVVSIARRGNLLSTSGTIHLIRFTAYLSSGVHNGDRPSDAQTGGPDPNPEFGGSG